MTNLKPRSNQKKESNLNGGDSAPNVVMEFFQTYSPTEVDNQLWEMTVDSLDNLKPPPDHLVRRNRLDLYRSLTQLIHNLKENY